MHPSEGLRGTRSKALMGKRIVLGITGSIAAVESFELARELIRHGAQVHAVLSQDAARLVTPWAMQFATGNPVIEKIDGQVQHVSLLGDVPDKADLLLIAPCTANTISKIACGIDDTPVTTMATIALGTGVPVMVAPAMHLSMYQNPMVRRNVEVLRQAGVELIGPRMEERKAKVAGVEEIVAQAIRRIGPRDYCGRKVLIVAGSSEEPVDEMRVLTNRGTGETGVLLAQAAFHRGAEVELWMGRCLVPIPSYLNVKRFSLVTELVHMAEGADHDLVVVPAALGDYAPEQAKGKIPSGRQELVLRLKPLPKVLSVLRPRTKILVGFKAEHGVGERELISRARSRLESVPLDMIVANDLKDVGQKGTKAVLLDREGGISRFKGSKAELADRVLDQVQGSRGKV